MLTTAESALPDLLRKQLRHNGVEQQRNINDKENMHRQTLDSDGDVSSDSSASEKLDFSLSFHQKNEEELEERCDSNSKWNKHFLSPLETESSARKADFSIQSLLSSNSLVSGLPSIEDTSETSSPSVALPSTPCSILNKQSLSTSQPHKAAQLVNFLQLQQSLQTCGEKGSHHNFQTKAFSAPSSTHSVPASCSPKGKTTDVPKSENPRNVFPSSFPTFHFQASPQMQGVHNHGSPFNFPTMVPRFPPAAPFGLSPFRPTFNPATIPLPWFQNEAFLRNLSDLTGM